MATRPGLAKGRRAPHITLATGARVRTNDSRWREAFEAADAVSEGAARADGGQGSGSTWFGSTSLILKIDAATEAERAFLAAVAERDLHVRTRALRMAVREATVRAGVELGGKARLGKSQCEIRFAVDPEGVRIDVDVQAPLIDGSARTRRRGA